MIRCVGQTATHTVTIANAGPTAYIWHMWDLVCTMLHRNLRYVIEHTKGGTNRIKFVSYGLIRITPVTLYGVQFVQPMTAPTAGNSMKIAQS